jgi:nitrous oxidase accessory protein NosD
VKAIYLILLSAASALAAVHEVTDFKSLVKACTDASPGDEIVIAKGIYRIAGDSRIRITSRPGPVTVRGATGKPEDVIIEGDGQDAKSVQMIFELTDSPKWTFRDLTTRNSYYHGFKFNLSSTDCVLRNVVMRDHGESGVKGTSDPDKGHYPDRLLVDGCDIGFTKETGGTRSVVEGIDGVAVKDWVIRNSRFVNVQKGGGPAYGVFTKGNSADTVIEGNRFENCFIGASFGGGGTGTDYFRDHDRSLEHRWGVIRNNLFINCTDAAIYINKGNACIIEDNRMIGCGMNIQLRFPETTGWVNDGNFTDNKKEPLVRIRDGAVLLKGEPPKHKP